jgi:hypothetical protein
MPKGVYNRKPKKGSKKGSSKKVTTSTSRKSSKVKKVR